MEKKQQINSSIQQTQSDSDIVISKEVVSPELPAAPTDLLSTVEISAPETLQFQAVTEGFNKSNAYAAARINDISRKNTNAAMLKIKQEARRKKYSLSELIYDTDRLMNALDEFDLICFEMNLYPIEHLLSLWLNCTMAEIQALKTSGRSSQAGQLLRMHSDYCVGLISQNALTSEKPPVFAMYYLKTVHQMYDIPTEQTININARQVPYNDISADILTSNAQIFSTLPDNSKKSD